MLNGYGARRVGVYAASRYLFSYQLASYCLPGAHQTDQTNLQGYSFISL